MPTIHKYACPITLSPGGAGVATFYSDAATDITVPLNTFWTSMMAKIPDNFTIAVPASGEAFDDSNGQVVGTWSGGTPGTHTGTPTGAYAGGSGGSIRWVTDDFVNGRRVSGRTFLIPLDAAVYDTNGLIATTQRSTMLTYASTFLTSTLGHLLVWHRPKAGAGGSSHTVQSCSMNLTPNSLRSRRL